MVNAWSLAYSTLNGTLDKDYPIMDKTKGRWSEDITITSIESDEYDIPHSDAYYDYTRNDPNAENPFTDPVDRAKAFEVTGQKPTYIYESPDGGKTVYRYERGTDPLKRELYDFDSDGLDYEINYYGDHMADVDDQRSHHFNFYGDLKESMYEPQRNHQFKYHEDEILKDIHEYVSNTYNGHYTGTKHEFRKVQTIDLMAARDIAAQFCQANILKYGSRYGSKDGRNKKDLLKVIHYAMLLLHFDGHYGEPSMPTDDFDQMP